jgi:thymidylate synthase ThyX
MWKQNAHALIKLIMSRIHPSAQWEIQQYAKALSEMFATVLPVTHRIVWGDK